MEDGGGIGTSFSLLKKKWHYHQRLHHLPPTKSSTVDTVKSIIIWILKDSSAYHTEFVSWRADHFLFVFILTLFFGEGEPKSCKGSRPSRGISFYKFAYLKSNNIPNPIFEGKGVKVVFQSSTPPFLGCFDTFPNNACPILIFPFSFPPSLLLLPSHISDITDNQTAGYLTMGHTFIIFQLFSLALQFLPNIS